MLIYNNCPLYNLKSKKNLKYLLKITDNRMLNQKYVASLVEPYIDLSGKPRLIEPPKQELKIIQQRIKKMLSKIDVPINVFSGIKGRSYVDNARFHMSGKPKYLFKIDLTAFFPSIKREKVYKFFLNNLACSSDVACVLTNFTTIDISKSSARNLESIYDFLNEKGVKCYNHLISGAPTSQILSYLSNKKMFDEIYSYSISNGIVMTIYVDDIAFSSENKISNKFIKHIFDIVKKYGYKISVNKTKLYTKECPKLITGVIIDKNGQITVKNSIRKAIIEEFKFLKENPYNHESRQRLKGLLTAARQVDRSIYPNIYNFAFNKESRILD